MMSKPIDGCAHNDELEDCYLVYLGVVFVRVLA